MNRGLSLGTDALTTTGTLQLTKTMVESRRDKQLQSEGRAGKKSTTLSRSPTATTERNDEAPGGTGTDDASAAHHRDPDLNIPATYGGGDWLYDHRLREANAASQPVVAQDEPLQYVPADDHLEVRAHVLSDRERHEPPG